MAEMDKTRAAIRERPIVHVCGGLDLCAGGGEDGGDLEATKDKILFMKGEESHSGSHAAHAAQWSMTGGGSLIRMGCHPCRPCSTSSRSRPGARRARHGHLGHRRCGQCLRVRHREERPHIKANPTDVEDWGMLTSTFSDGTKSDDVFRRHDHGRRAQCGRDLYQRRLADRQHHAEQSSGGLSDR